MRIKKYIPARHFLDVLPVLEAWGRLIIDDERNAFFAACLFERKVFPMLITVSHLQRIVDYTCSAFFHGLRDPFNNDPLLYGLHSIPSVIQMEQSLERCEIIEKFGKWTYYTLTTWAWRCSSFKEFQSMNETELTLFLLEKIGEGLKQLGFEVDL